VSQPSMGGRDFSPATKILPQMEEFAGLKPRLPGRPRGGVRQVRGQATAAVRPSAAATAFSIFVDMTFEMPGSCMVTP
jgi:hypothetical protein